MMRYEPGRGVITDVHNVDLPVTLRPQRRWSDEEFFQFCRLNGDLRIERWADGSIPVLPPTGAETRHRNAAFIAELNTWARGDGRGKTFASSAGWTLPDGSMLSPDASWVDLPRWEGLTKEQRERFAPLCPEFVVELSSPSDKLPTLREKMLAWLANGAELGWLIDPEARTVEIFRPGRAVEVVSGVDRLTADGPVAGFALDLSLIWSE